MALIASVCSAQVPTLRSTPQKPGLGPRSRVGIVELPNGYMQYNSKLDIVAMNYQLECFKSSICP